MRVFAAILAVILGSSAALAQSDPRANPAPAAKPEAKAKSEPKKQTKQGAKTGGKTEPKAEAKTEAKSENSTEANAKAKASRKDKAPAKSKPVPKPATTGSAAAVAPAGKPSGLQDTYAAIPPADRMAAFAQTGLPGRYAIGCFGRVRAQKGSDVFVEAMCRLLPRYPDFAAVLVGAVTTEHASFANDLKKRIEAAGLQSRIIITGELPIEEVQRWYQRLTIYAFTSRNEGFGLTLIEAMSAGAALVASRAGAAELVVEDGVTGVLMPPGDVDALVAALEPLMRDPAAAAQMGERARARVLEKFSLDAEAAGIAEVYRSLV